MPLVRQDLLARLALLVQQVQQVRTPSLPVRQAQPDQPDRQVQLDQPALTHLLLDLPDQLVLPVPPVHKEI